MMTLRISITFAAMYLLAVSIGAAADPRPENWQPDTVHKFKITQERLSTLKVLNVTTKTKEVYGMELTAKVGKPLESGQIPLTVQATRVFGEAPVADLTTFQVTPTQYDSKSGAKMPLHQFAPLVVLQSKPLTLLYDKNGKLSGVTGTKEWGAELVAVVQRDFGQDIDAPSSIPLYRMLGTEGAQKYFWDGLLSPNLPDDFIAGEEWSDKRVWSILPYYVWVNGKHTAQETDEGGFKITSSLIPPKSLDASIKLGPQEYIYSVKNGTGEGETDIDPTGWIKKSQSTVHIYLKYILKHNGQEIPMDDLYIKYTTIVERLD